MNIPVQCGCGTVTGFVDVRGLVVHGKCYCLDCQAFARFLGNPECTLDDKGGTEVIGTLPHRLHFTSGAEHLACITLSERGPLRWYAECCHTAIANGSRAPKTPFVTLHTRAIAASPAQIDRAFGRATCVFFAASATAPVKGPRLGLARAIPKILCNLFYSRISGTWRINPFFKPGTDEPISAPQALSREQRHTLRGDDSTG